MEGERGCGTAAAREFKLDAVERRVASFNALPIPMISRLPNDRQCLAEKDGLIKP
jgi:hypothetical protein